MPQSITFTTTENTNQITFDSSESTFTNITFEGQVAVAPTGPPGPQGDPGTPGAPGTPGVVQSLVAGNNIDIDATNPAAPIIAVEGLTLADITDVSASAAEVNVLDGITASTTELNYTDGLTSSAQTQLDAKQPLDADLTALAAAGNSAVLAATTASFLTADETKLDGIEALADVTDATNVAAAGAFMKSIDDTDDITTGATNKFATAAEKAKLAFISVTQAVDLDAIETNANNVPAIKTKTDFISVTQAVDLDQMETDIAALANGMVYKGDWDASAGTFPGAGAAQAGWFYYVSVAGTVDGVAFAVGDNLVATVDNASATVYAANWSKHDQTDAVSSVAGKVGAVTLVLADITDITATAAEVNYLSGVTSAIQTQINGKQALDSDLTAIAAIAPSNDDVIQRKAGAWTNRSMAQVKTDLVLVKADVGLGNVTNDAQLKIASNLSDLANAGTARTNLGLGSIAVLAAPSGTVVGTTDTQTLSNKRIVPRVGTVASSATPTINTDNVDAYSITALAANITSMTTNLSGTPNNFDKLIIRIKDDGTARTIAWGASFSAKGVALPTTTVISKMLTVGFIWDGSTWGCVASAQEA